MTLSDAALAAGLERRHWLCLPGEHRRVTWVLVVLGQQYRLTRRGPIPLVPTLAEQTTEQWRVSVRGPRVSAPKRKAG